MNKLLLNALLVGSISLSAFAYDTQKAKELENFYAGYTQKACADSKLFIQADEVMEMLRKKTKVTLLDIRTEGENAIISLSSKESLFIPIKDLFKKENLEKLPKDQPIFIVCHSGTRAILAAAGLHQIGIKNARVVQGGLVALANSNNPLNAPLN